MTRLRVLLLTGVCVLALTACREEETGQSLLAKARAAHDKGDARLALIHIQNSLKKNPANGEAELLYGRLLLETGNPTVAEEALGRAGRLGIGKTVIDPLRARAMVMAGRNQAVLDSITIPPNADAAVAVPMHIARGQAFLALGKPDAANQAFTAALILRPDDSDALLGQAACRAATGDRDGALAIADTVLVRHADHSEAWMMKADQLRELGRFQDSIAAYDRTLVLVPGAPTALRGRGTAHMGLNQRDKARADLTAARKAMQDDPQATLLLAWLDYQDGRFAEAQQLARSVQRQGNVHPGALLIDGAATLAMGAPQAAEGPLQSAVNAAPGNRLAIKLLAQAWLRMRQTARATALLDQAMRQWPDDASLMVLAAEARAAAGDHAGATTLLEAAAATEPNEPSLRARLGMAQLAGGNTQQALTSLEQASGLEKDGVEAQATLAMALLRTRAFDRALEIAQTIAERQPANPTGPYLAGLARLGLTQRDAARDGFRQALRLDPKYLSAAGQLAQMALADGKPEDAAQPFEAILAADPANLGAMLALASLAERRGEHAGRLRWLERARKADPKAIAPRAELVRAHLAMGADDAALTVAREAVAADPTSAQAAELLGQAELEGGEADRAVTAFRQMVKLAPYSGTAFVRLASGLMKVGQYRAAADAARNALRLSPGLLEAEGTLVLALAQAGEPTEARKVLAAIAARPDRAALAATLEGDVLRAEKRLPEAVAAYERAFKAAPNERLAIRLHGVRREDGDPAATAELRAAVEARPEWLTARGHLADVYLRDGRDREAAEQYETVLRRSPDDGRAMNNLASAYVRLRDPRARATAEAAYRLRPNNPATADTLGWLLVEQGDVGRGLPLLSAAVAALPREPSVRYHFAAALAKAGRKEEARTEIRRLLDAGGAVPDGATLGGLLD